MNHNYRIEFEDIVLQPLDEDTSERYRILRNKPEICKWFVFQGEISAEQQLRWFANYINNPNDVMFSIFSKQHGFIGANSIYGIHDAEAEYGRLIIDPAYSGNGYGVKATHAAAMIAKYQMGLASLNLEVYSNNYAALKTYQKVGFEETGILVNKNGIQMKTMRIQLNKKICDL